jgi:thymidylate kinase
VVCRLKSKKSVMENLETQLKVQEVYSMYVADGSLVRIDGNKSKREVAKAIWQTVSDHLRRTR